MRCPSDGKSMEVIQRKVDGMFIHISYKCPNCTYKKQITIMNPNFRQKRYR